MPVRQSRVDALIYRYRELGHLSACLDPLEACPSGHPLLELAAFDLSQEDLDRRFFTSHLSNSFSDSYSDAGGARLADIIQALNETYCRSIGVEFMHLQDPAERRWLLDRMEPVRNKPKFDREDKIRIFEALQRAGLFEQFLNKKYVGVTRFPSKEQTRSFLRSIFLQGGPHPKGAAKLFSGWLTGEGSTSRPIFSRNRTKKSSANSRIVTILRTSLAQEM
jgi:hypothetical protein